MVVAQLVEPLTPEIRSSNPDITIILLYQMYKRKDEIKGKEPGNGPSLKRDLQLKLQGFKRTDAVHCYV